MAVARADRGGSERASTGACANELSTRVGENRSQRRSNCGCAGTFNPLLVEKARGRARQGVEPAWATSRSTGSCGEPCTGGARKRHDAHSAPTVRRPLSATDRHRPAARMPAAMLRVGVAMYEAACYERVHQQRSAEALREALPMRPLPQGSALHVIFLSPGSFATRYRARVVVWGCTRKRLPWSARAKNPYALASV
jgi:hypothetical protein